MPEKVHSEGVSRVLPTEVLDPNYLDGPEEAFPEIPGRGNKVFQWDLLVSLEIKERLPKPVGEGNRYTYPALHRLSNEVVLEIELRLPEGKGDVPPEVGVEAR